MTDTLIIHTVIDTVTRATIIPGILCSLWLTGFLPFFAFQLSLLAALIVFVILPLIFRFSYSIQKSLLFLPFVKLPPNINYSAPSDQGLYGARNFYVTHHDEEEEVRLGVWHILPKTLVQVFRPVLRPPMPDEALANMTQPLDGVTDRLHADDDDDPLEVKSQARDLLAGLSKANADLDKLFEDSLRKLPGRIILYMHGNSGHRGAGHRVELYQLLQRLDCHVIAFDYRMYGDSSRVEPSEFGLVNDALAMYTYIKSVTSSPVFVWGHSLGTGVATHFMARLAADGLPQPQAVILESPFSNIRDEVRQHPFSWLFRHLPWFNLLIVQPMYNNNLRFESDRHVGAFRQPVMIIHAEDDLVVPFQLGYQLYRTALDVRGKTWGPVEFHRFEATSHYGHKFLCRAPELPRLVQTFLQVYEKEVF